MRRGTITILVVMALLALAPGMALARNVVCNLDADVCRGTSKSDTIRDSAGDDFIRALAGRLDDVTSTEGSDEILGEDGRDRIRDTTGGDQDEVAGGRGNDVINVADGDTGIPDPRDGVLVDDSVVCGAGNDRVISDPDDDVDPATCEVGGDVEAD